MATVHVSMLSGASVLLLGPGMLPTKVAEQLGCRRAQVALLHRTKELQDCDALEPLLAACVDIETTAMVQEAAYDPDRDDQEQLPALERLLCRMDGSACRRLAAVAPCWAQKLRSILTAEGLRAAVAPLHAEGSEVSDAALCVLAGAFGGSFSRSYMSPQDEELLVSSGNWWTAPHATRVAGEELATRDLLLAAGALRALPAVWHRLRREGKCWSEEQRLNLDHLLFCLLRGSPSPSPEDVAPAIPLLTELFTCMWRAPWREWRSPVRRWNAWSAHAALRCARELCCHEGHITPLLDAGLLRHLRALLTWRFFYLWQFGVLRLLHSLCAHGTEEHHDRIAGAGWLPFLLEPQPLDLLGRQSMDMKNMCASQRPTACTSLLGWWVPWAGLRPRHRVKTSS